MSTASQQSPARDLGDRHVGPEQAGHDAAAAVVTSQANAGMDLEAIEASAERVLADRFTRPGPASEAFYREYDHTAATLVADLRDLGRTEPDRTPGTRHPDPFLAGRGWHVCRHGIYTRQPERGTEAEAGA